MNTPASGLPDIDVLMQRVRAEVARRTQGARTAEAAASSPPLTYPAQAEAKARYGLPRLNTPELIEQTGKDRYAIDDLLSRHDEAFVRFAYRALLQRSPDTAGFDHYVRALRDGRLGKVEILGRLRYCAEGRTKRVKVPGLFVRFAVRSIVRLPWIGPVLAAPIYIFRLPRLMGTLEALDAHSQFVAQRGAHIVNGSLAQVEGALNDHRTQLEQIAQRVSTKADATTLAAVADAVSAKADVSALQDVAAALAGKADAAEVQSLSISVSAKADKALVEVAVADLLVQQQQRLEQLRIAYAEMERRSLLDRMELLELRRRLTAAPLTVEANRAAVAVAAAPVAGPDLDAYYVAFEDVFRGTREDIKNRVQVYLPYVHATAIADSHPLLDIGCGRGEWLELLGEHGVAARGIDLNRMMVEQCLARGLTVEHADALTALRQLTAGSLGAVTGLHLIEHMPLAQRVELLDECLRVLRPGGLLILETPNPENLLVGACNFYYDPTHIQPLPPEPTLYLVKARGFGNAQILRLHPMTQAAGLQLELLPAWVQQLLGAQDYAVVARRPA